MIPASRLPRVLDLRQPEAWEAILLVNGRPVPDSLWTSGAPVLDPEESKGSRAAETLPQDGRLYAADQLALYLGVSRRKVFSDLSRGAIPCVRLPGGAPRFDLAEIREWLRLGCPTAAEFAERKSES